MVPPDTSLLAGRVLEETVDSVLLAVGVIFLCRAIIKELLFCSPIVTGLDTDVAAVGRIPQPLKVVDKA